MHAHTTDPVPQLDIPEAKIISRYAALFLGGPDDPQPLFRDLDGDRDIILPNGRTASWDPFAVMAIVFDGRRFLHLMRDPYQPSSDLTMVVFYGNDGFPLNFRPSIKEHMSSSQKRILQLIPTHLEDWNGYAYDIAMRRERKVRVAA